MRVPDNFTDVAWYEDGVIPGDNGSSVIDGYVDNGLALAGVFKYLTDINNGDDIYVVTVGGDVLHFVVTSVDMYDSSSLPLEDIFNSSDGSQLRLITCAGRWLSSEKMYDKRLVVTARLQTVPPHVSDESLIN